METHSKSMKTNDCHWESIETHREKQQKYRTSYSINSTTIEKHANLYADRLLNIICNQLGGSLIHLHVVNTREGYQNQENGSSNLSSRLCFHQTPILTGVLTVFLKVSMCLDWNSQVLIELPIFT